MERNIEEEEERKRKIKYRLSRRSTNIIEALLPQYGIGVNHYQY